MTKRLEALGDERGQALVFVVLSIGVLIAVVALVIDAGNWFQAKQRAQSAAEAAAVAAAPQLLDNPAAVSGTVASTADTNWPGVQITQSQSAQSPTAKAIHVVAQPPAGSNLSPFGHFPISITASATASIQVPDEVNAVAPIIVVCTLCRQNGQPPGPWMTNPWYGTSTVPGPPITFQYIYGNSAQSTLAPVQFPGVSRNNFRQYVACDATDPGSNDCNQAPVKAAGYWQGLCLRNGCKPDANRLESRLSNAVNGETHLVAISDGYCGDCAGTSGYHVVGWGAGTFTNVSRTGPRVDLTMSFGSLLVDGKWLQPGGTGNPYDFGVRAIALTG